MTFSSGFCWQPRSSCPEGGTAYGGVSSSWPTYILSKVQGPRESMESQHGRKMIRVPGGSSAVQTQKASGGVRNDDANWYGRDQEGTDCRVWDLSRGRLEKWREEILILAALKKAKLGCKVGRGGRWKPVLVKCVFKRGSQTQLDLHSCGSHICELNHNIWQ